MARKNKQYTARRKPYEVYVAEYKKISSKHAMKLKLMNESTFNETYAKHKGTKNISKTLARKSRAVTTLRRKPYEVYLAEYKKISSRYDMQYKLMSESAYIKAYVMHGRIPNKSKYLARKSRAVNKAQAIAIKKAQTELTGKKVTWMNVMENANEISTEQWKDIQQTLQAWS